MILSNLLLLTILLSLPLLMLAVDAYSFRYDKYLRFHWKGALTSNSIIIKTFSFKSVLEDSGYSPFLVLYTKTGSSISTVDQILPLTFTSESFSMNDLSITGLTPSTKYFYTFIFTLASSLSSSDFQTYFGSSSPKEFSFSTFSAALTPFSFKFGAASCAQTGSNHPVFTRLEESNFDFFIHMGDLHYEDITANDLIPFYQAYYNVFSQPNQRAFFQSTPIQYLFDDHDFGSNDADGNVPSKPAATSAFKKLVPYYPLRNYLPEDDSTIVSGAPAGFTTAINYLTYNTGTYGIYRSFIVGRCLFILMDLRSFQDVLPEDILGEEQKNWLENQIRYAGNTAEIRQIFFVSSVPWVAQDGGILKESSVWDDYKPTQAMIARLVEQYIYHNDKKVVLIAGDAHMIALDDGRNNEFGGFPVVQAASLDRRGSCKGGPYSHGYHTGNDHYSVFEVTDDGSDTICVKIVLMEGGTESIVYDTCHPELYPSNKNHKCGISWRGWLIIFGPIVFFFLIVGTVLWFRRNRRKKMLSLKKKKQQEMQATGMQKYKEDVFGSDANEPSGVIEPPGGQQEKFSAGLKNKLEARKTNDASGQEEDSAKIKSEYKEGTFCEREHLTDVNGQLTPKEGEVADASPVRRNMIYSH